MFELDGALRAASILYVVTLGLIGFVAVRRTHLAWWKQLVAIGNVLVQARAQGFAGGDLESLRALVASAFAPTRYEPAVR